MTQLVKFITNEDLDLCLKSLQLSHPDCNTNAAAAKLALLNYQSECDHHRETKKELIEVTKKLQHLEAILFDDLELAERKEKYRARLYAL